jgi:aspartyl/glutamyl-tRNA(Asn/Gln) amidotransferase C subunit
VISKEDIQKLAELSRIKLTDGEVESLQKDISNILDYVGQVSAAGQGSDGPKAGENRNVMRDDIPHTKDSPLYGAREAILEALPRREGDFAVVRKILHKND